MPRSQTVRVATVHDQAEATLIRSMLSAHGIEAMIPEGGSSAGVAAVGFITHVFVDPEDAEQATALIEELRASASPLADDPDDDDDELPALGTSLERRTRIPALILVGVMLQFGTAHLFSGAWKRGLALAALEIYGIRLLVHGHWAGTAVIAAAVLLDLAGSIVRAYRRASVAARLPVAQLRGSGSRDRR